jgi:adenosylhomocysteine nucleosidase
MNCMLMLVLFSLYAPERVGIIGAMDIELTLIKDVMVIQRTDTIADRIFTTGMLNNIPCVCVKAGIGKVNAALTAQILIDKYDVDMIIFTGVAGGIDPGLSVGDIVISERVIHHDYGMITPASFIPWDTLGFKADTGLVRLAFEVAKYVEFDPVPENLGIHNHLPSIVIGTVVTGDQFIASEEKRQWLEHSFDAACVEMEGAAVAQVCALHDIPFLIIRCLSDLANEEAEIDFAVFVEYAAGNSSLFVREIFLHLATE